MAYALHQKPVILIVIPLVLDPSVLILEPHMVDQVMPSPCFTYGTSCYLLIASLTYPLE